MSRMPYAIAATVMIAGLLWTIHLLATPGPWELDAAMAVATGTLVLSIAAMASLLLSRGRWTRYFAAALLVAELLITLVAEVDGWLIAAVAVTGIALAGLGGPWFKGWLRELPAAGSPGYEPIALAIATFSLVPAVGIASPAGLEPAHGALGAAGVLFSWAYMRANTWALLGLRLAVPVLTVLAAVSSPPAGAITLLAFGAVITYLAWTKPARLAVDPMPGLPAPRRRRS